MAHLGMPKANPSEFRQMARRMHRRSDVQMIESTQHTARTGARKGPNKWPHALIIISSALAVTAACGSADDRDSPGEPDSSAGPDSSGEPDSSADQQVAVPCAQSFSGFKCPPYCDFCAHTGCPYAQVCANHGCFSCVGGFWQFSHVECDCLPYDAGPDVNADG